MAARWSRSTSPAGCRARRRRRARPRRRSSATARAASASRWSTRPPPPEGSASWCWPRPRRRGEGKGAKEIVAHVAEARAEFKLWFAIDTLEFLKRGGRIGAASAWIGSTLKVKPILTVENEMTPVERVRTSSRAFERMVDYARQRHESGADAWSCAAHPRARSVRRAGRALHRGLRLPANDHQRARAGARRRTQARACWASAACPSASWSRRRGTRGEYRPGCTLSEDDPAHRVHGRRRGDRALPDLPAAQADQLAADLRCSSRSRSRAR